jgi:hypothetical protein
VYMKRFESTVSKIEIGQKTSFFEVFCRLRGF